jgi:hypothetical protein
VLAFLSSCTLKAAQLDVTFFYRCMTRLTIHLHHLGDKL